MRVIILSAGFGKRLRPHTEKLAKPAIEFLGLPGLSYPLFLAESLNPEKIVFNLHHLPETVKAAVLKVRGDDYEVVFTEEQPEILDSGGGIKNAESALKGGGRFLSLNGDTVLLLSSTETLKKMLAAHDGKNPIATLLVQRHKNAGDSHGGVFTKPDSLEVTHFARQKTTETTTPWHYLGVAIYSDRLFDYLPKGEPSNVLYDGLTAALKAGETVWVHEAPEALWYETGNESDFLAAQKALIHEVQNETVHGEFLKQIQTRFQPEIPDTDWVGFLMNQSNTLQSPN